MHYKYEEATKIMDFDEFDVYKATSIMELFQEVAGIDATRLGFGYTSLVNRDLIWVVLRTKFDVIRLPEQMEKLTVETWPLPKGRADFDRNYLIKDSNNEVIIKGISKWCIIKNSNRTLVRANELFDYPNCEDAEVLYEDKFTKLDVFNKEDMKYVYNYHIYKMDIDHNRHVNNSRYCNMAFNAFELNGRKIKSFQIDHLHEAKFDDDISIYLVDNNNEVFVQGYKEDELLFVIKYIF